MSTYDRARYISVNQKQSKGHPVYCIKICITSKFHAHCLPTSSHVRQKNKEIFVSSARRLFHFM